MKLFASEHKLLVDLISNDRQLSLVRHWVSESGLIWFVSRESRTCEYVQDVLAGEHRAAGVGGVVDKDCGSVRVDQRRHVRQVTLPPALSLQPIKSSRAYRQGRMVVPYQKVVRANLNATCLG